MKPRNRVCRVCDRDGAKRRTAQLGWWETSRGMEGEVTWGGGRGHMGWRERSRGVEGEVTWGGGRGHVGWRERSRGVEAQVT